MTISFVFAPASKKLSEVFSIWCFATLASCLLFSFTASAQSTSAGGGGDRPTARMRMVCQTGDVLFNASAQTSADVSPYLVCQGGKFVLPGQRSEPVYRGSTGFACREGETWVTAEFEARSERMISVTKVCRQGRFVRD